MRIGLGPVFAYEWLMASRRWQIYAGRALLVAFLLIGMTLVWMSFRLGPGRVNAQVLATLGQKFANALLSTELVLALLVPPAAAAGAICQDKARGGLTHLLMTDLSDGELVLGKLAARLMVILGMIAGGLPVLAIASLLGGVDPWAATGATLVIVGIAVLGVCLALVFSIWATRPHEALMATYAVWAVWLFGLLVASEVLGINFASSGLIAANPFQLVLDWERPGSWDVFRPQARFFLACVLLSCLLAALAIWRLRPVLLRQASRSHKAKAARASWLPGPSLDRDPILWREWQRRRPSAWSRAIWWLYAVVATIFSIVALFSSYIGPGVCGFTVSVGLLLVSLNSATSLAEERTRGSLDVLMTTPLSSRSIVLGKWLGSFRAVPPLAILPTLVVFVEGTRFFKGTIGPVAGPFLADFAAAMMVGLVIGYGAVITSLGLALATFQRRLGRAIAITTSLYLMFTVVWPTIGIVFLDAGPRSFLTSLWPSPFFGPYGLASWAQGWGWSPSRTESFEVLGLMSVVIVAMLALALALLLWVLWGFDRRMGRMPEQSARPPAPVAAVLAAD